MRQQQSSSTTDKLEIGSSSFEESQDSSTAFGAVFDRYRERLHTKDPSLVVDGPLLGDICPSFLVEIKCFRSVQYSKHLTYLLSADHSAIEEMHNFDGRSAHFCARRRDSIVGSVRATPEPFEFEVLADIKPTSIASRSNYIELSRLVVDADSGRNTVARQLLAFVCVWAMNEGYSGILGFCRKGARTLFERYGLHLASADEYRVPWRGSHKYFLMIGSWREIAGSKELEPESRSIFTSQLDVNIR